MACPWVTRKERCRYSAHLAGVRKRVCVGVTMATPSDPTSCKRGRSCLYGTPPDSEASLWTPTFKKHPEPVRLPHQFALASYCKLLSHSLFLPPHNFLPLVSTSHPLRFLHNKDSHVTSFERQKVSPEIQDLPSDPETAMMQWKTGLLKQL